MPAENNAHKHQLKPCPLCGSADLTLDNLGQRNDWFVSCNICEVQLIANYTEAQAVALWNKRAVLDWVPVAHAMFKAWGASTHDGAWFDYQSKAQLLVEAINSPTT